MEIVEFWLRRRFRAGFAKSAAGNYAHRDMDCDRAVRR
jgi:hypothetical protein